MASWLGQVPNTRKVNAIVNAAASLLHRRNRREAYICIRPRDEDSHYMEALSKLPSSSSPESFLAALPISLSRGAIAPPVSASRPPPPDPRQGPLPSRLQRGPGHFDKPGSWLGRPLSAWLGRFDFGDVWLASLEASTAGPRGPQAPGRWLTRMCCRCFPPRDTSSRAPIP